MTAAQRKDGPPLSSEIHGQNMKTLLIFLLTCGALAVAVTPAMGGEWKAWFDIRKSGSLLAVTAYCRGGKEGRVRYRMDTWKRGSSGTSSSSQSGVALAVPNEATALSRLNLGLSPGDTYRIALMLFENGVLVAEEKLVYPEDQSP
jgi:hypothetical protein